MTETPKQSDQLPEEAPAEQVPDDVPAAGEGAARESSERQAEQTNRLGYRDADEQAAYDEAGDQAALDSPPSDEEDDDE
jgi:hypothetical protein